MFVVANTFEPAFTGISSFFFVIDPKSMLVKGLGLISNWALYGTIGYGPLLDNFGDQPYGFSWTDGTPTATATTTGHGTANYVYVGSLGSGFQISVPADTTKKLLKLYYMGWECRTPHYGHAQRQQRA
jgi:hypothetical protein